MVNKNSKILLFISPDLSLGGVGKGLSMVINDLASRQYLKIHLLLFKKLIQNKIYKENVTIHFSPLADNKTHLYASFILNIVYTMVLIKKLKPTAVISHGIYCNLVSSIVKMFFGDKVKTVVQEHNTPSIHFKLRGRFWGFILKQVIKNVYYRNDLVIAVSKGVLEELLQISPKINTKKAVVLYNAVNINEIKEMAKEEVSGSEVPHREGMVITSVGRLVPQKDYSTLLHALKLVSEKYRATLLIVGDGPEKERLIQLSEKLLLKDSVIFLGYQRNPYKYINLSDIFVLSSLCESFGVVIVEALSLGKPVVATDCPYGPREILDNGNFGLLAKVGNHFDLAEQLIKLMSSPDLYAKLSELSMRRAYDFLLKDKIDKFIAMLDHI